MPSSPQGKGPQRFGRSDARWSPGERLAGRSSGWRRVSGPRANWPWSVIQSANATFCVGIGCCPGAASGAMASTTSQTTSDTRRIASSGAAEGELRTGRQRPGRGAIVIFACDSRATRPGRGWRAAEGLSFSSLVAADREGPDAFYPAVTPPTASPQPRSSGKGPLCDKDRCDGDLGCDDLPASVGHAEPDVDRSDEDQSEGVDSGRS
jgi:hypothetical protein